MVSVLLGEVKTSVKRRTDPVDLRRLRLVLGDGVRDGDNDDGDTDGDEVVRWIRRRTRRVGLGEFGDFGYDDFSSIYGSK